MIRRLGTFVEFSVLRELVTVDQYSWNPFGLPPDVHHDVTRHLLAEAVAKFNVRMLREEKGAFYRAYAGPAPSLVFLDANHDYEPTREDILWARQVRAVNQLL